MTKLLLVSAILLIIGSAVAVDHFDRNELCEHYKCNRQDIERQFFHFYGNMCRVYYVKGGNRVVVNGVIWREISEVK